MHAIILAGGFGTRLANVSGGKPKPLVEVRGKPILEHQIDLLFRHGLKDIRLSLYYKAKEIISFCENRWPGKLKFLVEPRLLGTGGAIKFASRDLKDDFLVTNGDLLSNLDIKEFTKHDSNTIACSFVDDARSFGLLKIKNNKVCEFLEKPKEKVSGFVNSGFYILHPRIFSSFPQEEFMIEKEVFPVLAKQGELNAYLHDDFWIDVGTEERWREANQ